MMNQTLEIPIKGMTCAACAQAVQRALKKVEGVKAAEVNLLTEIARIQTESNVDIKRLISIVRATGYDIGKKSLYLQMGEFDAEIEKLLQEKISNLHGVIEIKGDIVNKNLLIEYVPTIIEEGKIISFIKSLGLKSQKYSDTLKEEEEKQKDFKKLKRDLYLSFLLTLPVFLGSMFHFPFLNDGYVQLLLTSPVQFIMGMRFHLLAFLALRHGTANMNSLVSLGTNSAYFYSLITLIFGSGSPLYFETSAVIITLILFGRTLEEKAKAKTSEAIKELMQRQPKKAVVLRNGKELEIKIEEVLVDDIVIVKASEKIPVDGVIIEGMGTIDESMITGEPIPVDKSVGERVIGGTILLSGLIKIEAKAVGNDALLSQIIKLIKEAQTGKPPVQRLADKISALFVPMVLAVALLTFIIWMILKNDFPMALSNSIAVLIIACPCALGLATPTAIMVATGRAAKEGIVMRNVEKIEEIGKVEIIFTDKTGTLTQGKPEVKSVQYFGDDSREILKLTSTAEKYSEHPLAKAILRHCLREEILPGEPLEFEVIAGGGVKAKVLDSQGMAREILIGSNKLMLKKGITLPDFSFFEPATKVYVAVDNTIKALFLITDPIREESLTLVKELKNLNVELIILTGDNESSAKAVGDKLGIEKIYAEMLPQEKAKIVRQYRVTHRKVTIMVGDGINDAPALAEANVGIAMGSGTDIAINTADVILMKGSLRGIPILIKLSNITLRTIKENLFWAFIYNIIGIPVAAGILYIFGGPLMNPMLASLAMSLSSVSVVSNSLLLKRKKI